MKRLITLAVITLLDIGLVTTTALWPIKDSLSDVENIKQVIKSYSVAASNLDVWAATLVYILSMALLLWKASRVGCKQRHGFTSLAEPVFNRRVGA